MNDKDSIRRFLFEDLGIRGEWIQIENSWKQASQHQNLNDFASQQLGQALAAVTLLAATIKFNGSLILQIQGSGALKTLVAQSTHDKKIRGIARVDEQKKVTDFAGLAGDGNLVLTIEPETGEPYQGIVPLEGRHLNEAISYYFEQSEQLPTQVWLFSDQDKVSGLFLQAIPSESRHDDDWERICALANTLTAEELLALDCETMLYRLFNEEKVRLFETETIEFKCSCNEQKIENTLFMLGRTELETILQERNLIEVDCQFCARKFSFDQVDIEKILNSGMDNHSNARH